MQFSQYGKTPATSIEMFIQLNLGDVEEDDAWGSGLESEFL